MGRTKPNVLVTGTPGVGKTTTAEQIAAAVAGETQLPRQVPLTSTVYLVCGVGWHTRGLHGTVGGYLREKLEEASKSEE